MEPPTGQKFTGASWRALWCAARLVLLLRGAQKYLRGLLLPAPRPRLRVRGKWPGTYQKSHCRWQPERNFAPRKVHRH